MRAASVARRQRPNGDGMFRSSCVSSPIAPDSSSWPVTADWRSSTASCSPTATRRSRRTRRSARASTRSCSSPSSAAPRGRRTRSSASRRAPSSARDGGHGEVTWYDVDGGGPPTSPSGTTPRSDRRARRGSGELRARRCRRACRASGAARSAGSPTTACARSRICPRVKPDDLGLPDALLGRHRHAAHLRQPAPDAQGRRDAVRRATASAPRPRYDARARASTRSSTALRAPAPPLRALEPPRRRPRRRLPAVVVHAATTYERRRRARQGVHPRRRRVPGRAVAALRGPRAATSTRSTSIARCA